MDHCFQLDTHNSVYVTNPSVDQLELEKFIVKRTICKHTICKQTYYI